VGGWPDMGVKGEVGAGLIGRFVKPGNRGEMGEYRVSVTSVSGSESWKIDSYPDRANSPPKHYNHLCLCFNHFMVEVREK
jgi:hypothetical protein